MAPVGAWPPLAPEGGPRPAPPELWEPLVSQLTRVACALVLRWTQHHHHCQNLRTLQGLETRVWIVMRIVEEEQGPLYWEGGQ